MPLIVPFPVGSVPDAMVVQVPEALLLIVQLTGSPRLWEMVVCKVGIRGMSKDTLEGLVFVNDITVGIVS